MKTGFSNEDGGYVSKLAFWLGLILLIRLFSLWHNNSQLFFDEAQYWYWAKHFSFGYFSKPPLLAWLIGITTGVSGSDMSFFVRLAAPLMHIGTAIVIFLTARHLFGARVGFWAGILFATLPAVSLSSTIISTDVPLLFFWSIALFAYVRLAEEYEMRWAWILGLSLGLALNSKYAAVYFLGCALVHSFVEQRDFTPPRLKQFWIAMVVAFAMLVPNALWNLQNGFVTISHTGENIGWQGFDLNWRGALEFFGSQFGVFGPILFGIYIASCLRIRNPGFSHRHRMLVSFSLPIILIVIIQALLNKANANWAAPAFVAGTILVAEVLINKVPWHWIRSSMIIHGIAFLAISIAVMFAGPGQLVLPSGYQPFLRTQGASEIASAVSEKLDSQEFQALVTPTRKLSALMHYNLRNRDEAILAWRAQPNPRDHFQLVSAFQDSPNSPALLMSRTRNPDYLVEAFERIEFLGSAEIQSGEIREIHFFKLENFKNPESENLEK